MFRFLTLLLLSLTVLACGGEDLAPYVQASDRLIEEMNTTSRQLGTDLANLEFASAAAFPRAETTLEALATSIAGYRAKWAEITPTKGSRSHHDGVATLLRDLEALLKAMAEGARAKSAEQIFIAMSPMADLTNRQNDLNQEWIGLAKEAGFDASRAEAKAKANTVETKALRAYAVEVMPLFGAIVDAFRNVGSPAAPDSSGQSRSQALVQAGREAASRTKQALAAVRAPSAAAQSHKAIVGMIDGMEKLFDAIELGRGSGSNRALAESYRALRPFYDSALLGDCEWRNLMSAAEFSTAAPRACTTLGVERARDLDYAVGAFIVYGGTVDALLLASPAFASASGQPGPQAFAILRTPVATLNSAASDLLSEANRLEPPPSRASFQGTLVSYLTDLSVLARDLQAALNSNDTSRYNALIPRVNDVLAPRLQALSSEFTAMWAAASSYK